MLDRVRTCLPRREHEVLRLKAAGRHAGQPGSHRIANQGHRVDARAESHGERARSHGQEPSCEERDVVTSLTRADEVVENVLEEPVGIRRSAGNGRTKLGEPHVERTPASLHEPIRIEDENASRGKLDRLLTVPRGHARPER